jgi:hypothetical protein
VGIPTHCRAGYLSKLSNQKSAFPVRWIKQDHHCWLFRYKQNFGAPIVIRDFVTWDFNTELENIRSAREHLWR